MAVMEQKGQRRQYLEQEQQQQQKQSDLSLLDSLYCEEEKFEDDEEEEDEVVSRECVISTSSSPSSPLFMLEQDMFWEDDELVSLFAKEQELQPQAEMDLEIREEAVDWILKVTAHYGFKILTAVLSMNYLDRFLFSFTFRRDTPWMVQLVAVTCLSLAAKVEETQVPLLLDLQVMETKYVFEAKTIQRMELLVLSTLQWKMHPVTPVSFLDHIIRRLGLRTNLHWDFLKRCECHLLSVVSDSRFVGYLPSVLATATMMYVIDQVEPSNPVDYHHQLLDALKTSKEKVKECYNLIQNQKIIINRLKRKSCCHEPTPRSPSCVMDPEPFRSDSSNDSWASSHSCSLASNPLAEQPPLKKMVREQQEESSIHLAVASLSTASRARAIIASP